MKKEAFLCLFFHAFAREASKLAYSVPDGLGLCLRRDLQVGVIFNLL